MRRRTVIVSMMLLLSFLLITSGGADSIQLPSELISIDDEAFAGCESISELYLPENLISIADSSLSGTSEILWVHCPQGEIAERLLKSCIDVDAHTICRALIIAQTYVDTDLELNGPLNDAAALSVCLRSCANLNYHIVQMSNLTANGIVSCIGSTFSEANQYDISVIFYSGHGEEDGALVGVDGSLLTAKALRNALDSVPGRKIVIIDACFSGGFIEAADNQKSTNSLFSVNAVYSAKESVSEEEQISAFNDAFLNAFSNNSLLRGDQTTEFSQYYIMTSAKVYQTSEEAPIQSGGISKTMGYFSYYLCKGCGWDGVQDTHVMLYADANSDGIVSFGEAFIYAKRQARMQNNQQDAQSNMADCQSFSPFR